MYLFHTFIVQHLKLSSSNMQQGRKTPLVPPAVVSLGSQQNETATGNQSTIILWCLCFVLLCYEVFEHADSGPKLHISRYKNLIHL